MTTKLKDCINECPEEFKELDVLFYAYWSSYEDCGWIVVFDFLGELMVDQGGDSAMAENHDHIFSPDPYVNNFESEIEAIRTNTEDPWCSWTIEVDLLEK